MGNNKLLAQGLAEFFGTIILASAIFSAITAGLSMGLVAIIGGLTLALLVFAIGPLSGSHVNPAVTVSLWTLKKIETSRAITYLVAQCFGGVVALLLFQYLIKGPNTGLPTGDFELRIFIGEALGTAVFLFVLAAGIVRKYQGGALAATVGGGLFLGIVVAAFASNAILNPALAISFQDFNWTYVLAPLVGGIIGANLFARALAPEETKAAPKSTKKK